MLRYQLNPHFLFNTLNAISTLILDGQAKVANLAVTRLSDFLRYTLDKDPMKRVTLRQELDALNLYLGHREAALRRPAQARRSTSRSGLPGAGALADPAAADRERAQVRGGAARGGRTPADRGRVRGRTLGLAVQDDGPGLARGVEPGDGRGVGLRNTRERLAVLYGDHNA